MSSDEKLTPTERCVYAMEKLAWPSKHIIFPFLFPVDCLSDLFFSSFPPYH